MNTLADLKSMADNIKNETSGKESDLQEQCNAYFEQDKSLQKQMEELECSEEYSYSSDGSGEIVRRYEFDFSDYELEDECYSLVKECLLEYIAENYFAYPDQYNGDYLEMNEGESIVINDDGEAYESGKLITKRKDHMVMTEDEDGDEIETDEQDESAFFQAIEDYMQSSGCFSSVFHSDYHGNIHLADDYYEWLKNSQKKKNVKDWPISIADDTKHRREDIHKPIL